MTKLPVENPLNEVFNAIVKAVDVWKSKNTPDAIEKQVYTLLDHSSAEITKKLLGFNQGYDSSWSLDHCNGRSGNSAAGDYLQRNQQAAIDKWLEQIDMPPLSATEITRYRKEFKDHFSYKLREHVQKLAEQEAIRCSAEIMQQVAGAGVFDSYKKLVELINPTP